MANNNTRPGQPDELVPDDVPVVGDAEASASDAASEDAGLDLTDRIFGLQDASEDIGGRPPRGRRARGQAQADGEAVDTDVDSAADDTPPAVPDVPDPVAEEVTPAAETAAPAVVHRTRSRSARAKAQASAAVDAAADKGQEAVDATLTKAGAATDSALADMHALAATAAADTAAAVAKAKPVASKAKAVAAKAKATVQGAEETVAAPLEGAQADDVEEVAVDKVGQVAPDTVETDVEAAGADTTDAAEAAKAAAKPPRVRPVKAKAKTVADEEAVQASSDEVSDSEEADGEDETVRQPTRKLTQAPVKKAAATRKRDEANQTVATRTTPLMFVRQAIGELKKVVWPSGDTVGQYFIVVLVFVLVVMGIVFGLDQLFGWALLKLFG